jgi:Domain of unknown function (DU1801)
MVAKESLGKFEDILAIATPQLRPVCESLRDQITSLHGGFVEVVWPKQKIASFGVGPKKMTEHYAYIAVQGSHINLGFYHGTSLADPTSLLEGTGNELRHVKLRDVASTKNAAVTALLRQAIAERKRHATEA